MPLMFGTSWLLAQNLGNHCCNLIGCWDWKNLFGSKPVNRLCKIVRKCAWACADGRVHALDCFAPDIQCRHHSHTTQNYSTHVVDEVRSWIAGQIALQLAFFPFTVPPHGSSLSLSSGSEELMRPGWSESVSSADKRSSCMA